MKIIVTFLPNDFCVSKLHGFDPKFSEESFKIGLKFVGCAVKELWIFNYLIWFNLINLFIFNLLVLCVYSFLFENKELDQMGNWYNLLSVGNIEDG